MGAFSIKRPCPQCLGRGKIVAKPCKDCLGRGFSLRDKTVSVKIPSGMKPGKKIRLKGLGHSSISGGDPGDLYLKVELLPDTSSDVSHASSGGSASSTHKSSLRSSSVEVEVNPVVAMLGGKVTVYLDDGSSIKISVPAGAKDGSTMRLKGASSDGRDLKVHIKVSGDEKLSAKARELMKEINDDSWEE